MSGVAPLRIDTAATQVLASTNVMPVLGAAPTLSGFSQAGPGAALVTLSDLATFFAANAGAITTAGPVTITGTGAAPAGTVRYLGSPGGSATDLVANVPTGGTHVLRVANTNKLLVTASTMTLGASGAAYALAGSTATGTDTASGALTFKGNIGTGAGTVGGYIFQVPVTHGSDSVAQTLTTVFQMDATTTVRIGFYGVTPTTRQTLATGTGKTVDDVITALQTLGLVKQS